MIKIRTFIGCKLNYINGILRRQIELDRYLKNRSDVKLYYEYYEKPKNPIDFFSKRYVLYPYYSRKEDKNEDTINHITFQYLGDLGLFLNKSRTLITCHDIFTFLERNNLKNPYFLQKYSLYGLKKCKFIISISNFTKNELIEKFNIPNDKIMVIQNGINKNMFFPVSKSEMDKIKPLYPHFVKILHVGSEVYRKDFLTLLKAVYLVKKKLKTLKLLELDNQLIKR